LSQVDGRIMSAFIRATKPATKTCCGPTCCSWTRADSPASGGGLS